MPNCIQCTASTACTLCASSYLINNAGTGCVSSCNLDEIADSTVTRCVKCTLSIANCNSCASSDGGVTVDICNSCSSSLFFIYKINYL